MTIKELVKLGDNIKDLSLLPCEHLTGVGKRTAERLAHLGIHCVQDVLFHLPSRYQDRTTIYPLRQLIPGEHAVIEGQIDQVSFPKGGRTRLLCRVVDPSGRLHLRFFYLNALQRKTLSEGTRLRCFGETRLGPQGLEMIHPEYRIISPDNPLPVDENLTPIYPTTDGLSQLTWRKLTSQALQLLEKGGVLNDILPLELLNEFAFPTLREALQYVHRPPQHAPLSLLAEGKHISQQRLVFEELLAHRLSLLHLKKHFQVQPAIALPAQHNLINTFLKNLPFELTSAQKRVLDEIKQDITKPNPMLRLVQGDVGSGKTVVAALAMLQAVENQVQSAVLAPTELLIEQHYHTFRAWLEPLGVNVVMLSGQMKTAAKRDALNAIQEGHAHIILGTHALFQKDVTFSKLALIVVDEQHRFGVDQRALLRQKGLHADSYPHQLIMTATPIPRTLAMSLYADLDYSVIDELPKGRIPPTTTVIDNSRRDEVLTRIQNACKEGRQAYWVCTLIEESETLQCQTAVETAEKLRAVLAPLKVGFIHGRMKPHEKEDVMSHFKKGDYHLLVATTVIEVGVDVPNASVMIIENAERLGLAQLHQLRGRVGRGAIASHCVLLYQAPLSRLAEARLAVMRETTDGFKIAQRDLEIRGPGEVLGTRQTGDITLRVADLLRDSQLLPKVQKFADDLIAQYPERVNLLIQRWIGSRAQYGRV